MPSRLSDRSVPGPPDRSVPGLRSAALVLGLIATLAALVVPFAPVTQDRVTMSWPAAGADPAVTAVALPLLPYQPVELAATVPCAGRPAGTVLLSTVLLSTVPLRSDPGAPLLPGLRVDQADGSLLVSSYGRQVARTTVPAGPCTLQIRSDPDRTAVTLNGPQIGEVRGDVRPVVVGAFTEASSTAGLRLELVTDTRFQTSMTPLKAALAGLSGLALLGALWAVARLDNRSNRTRRVPVLPRRWWRPRAVDLVVTGGLALWAVIGPITVDDGYIAGIIRTRDTAGYIGNLYRWLNAPEAPFGWVYELYSLWSAVSAAPLWLRVPSTALGLACWLLLSRALLPRLGSFAAQPATVWVAAAVFGAWWLPFNLGLRPEPWVAVAGLITLLAVERAVVTRRLLPVLVGLVVAGAAIAVTPTGIVALTPFLAAAVPLLRALRQRPELPGLVLLVLLVAAPSSALLLAFGDQTLASVAEAIRIRALIGGGLPWHQELQRYAELVTPGSIEGSLQRRVPVLLTLVGLAGTAWLLGRRRAAGIAAGPVARVCLTLVLSLAAMTFTPTKWTYHFGALAGVGSAVLVVALHAWSRRALQAHQAHQTQPDVARTVAAAAAGTAAFAVAAGVALAGFNQWPYVSNYGVTWSTLAPQLGGVPASSVVLAGGLLLAGVGGAAAAWVLAGGRPASIARWLPTPGRLALVLIVGTVLLQVASLARAGIERSGSYSVAAGNVAELAGSSCGLADYLRVEPDPQAGLLAASGTDGAQLDGFVPVPGGPAGAGLLDAGPLEMAGVALPGWVAAGVGDPAQGSTAWYRLDDRGGPLVITVSGELGPGGRVVAEFGRSAGTGGAPAGTTVTPLATIAFTDQPGAPATRDLRIIATDGPEADVVRLTVTAARHPGTVPLAFSQPRSPRTTPMTTVLPPGTEAMLDWPVAFLFPCLEIAGTPDGTAPIPHWRVGPPSSDSSDHIITAPANGGPFAAPRALVRTEQVPVYLDGEPLRDVGTLYRWQPITPLAPPGISREREVVGGWQGRGHLHVPTATAPQTVTPQPTATQPTATQPATRSGTSADR